MGDHDYAEYVQKKSREREVELQAKAPPTPPKDIAHQEVAVDGNRDDDLFKDHGIDTSVKIISHAEVERGVDNALNDDKLTEKERIQLFASFLIFCALVIAAVAVTGGYLKLAFP